MKCPEGREAMKWLCLVAMFTGANGWHGLWHQGHPFWGGVLLGLSWCFGVAVVKLERSEDE